MRLIYFVPFEDTDWEGGQILLHNKNVKAQHSNIYQATAVCVVLFAQQENRWKPFGNN